MQNQIDYDLLNGGTDAPYEEPMMPDGAPREIEEDRDETQYDDGGSADVKTLLQMRDADMLGVAQNRPTVDNYANLSMRGTTVPTARGEAYQTPGEKNVENYVYAKVDDILDATYTVPQLLPNLDTSTKMTVLYNNCVRHVENCNVEILPTFAKMCKVITKDQIARLRGFDHLTIEECALLLTQIVSKGETKVQLSHTMLRQEGYKGVKLNGSLATVNEYQFDYKYSSAYVPCWKIFPGGLRQEVVAPPTAAQLAWIGTITDGYQFDQYVRDVALLYRHRKTGEEISFPMLELRKADGKAVVWKFDASSDMGRMLKLIPSQGNFEERFVSLVSLCMKNKVVPRISFGQRVLLPTTIVEMMSRPCAVENVDDPNAFTYPSLMAAFVELRRDTVLNTGLMKSTGALFTKSKDVDPKYIPKADVMAKMQPVLDQYDACIDKIDAIVYIGATPSRNLQVTMVAQYANDKKKVILIGDLNASTGVSKVDCGNVEELKNFLESVKGLRFVVHLDVALAEMSKDTGTNTNAIPTRYAQNCIEAGAKIVTYKANLAASIKSDYKCSWLMTGKRAVHGRLHAHEGIAFMTSLRKVSNVQNYVQMASSSIHENSVLGKEFVRGVIAGNAQRGMKRSMLDNGYVYCFVSPQEAGGKKSKYLTFTDEEVTEQVGTTFDNFDEALTDGQVERELGTVNVSWVNMDDDVKWVGKNIMFLGASATKELLIAHNGDLCDAFSARIKEESYYTARDGRKGYTFSAREFVFKSFGSDARVSARVFMNGDRIMVTVNVGGLQKKSTCQLTSGTDERMSFFKSSE